MRPSEFARNITEADVALGRLEGFTCTESRCEELRVTCNNQDIEKTRELLVKLREFGLPDLLAELEKIVGRQVTLHDICAFWGFTRLYPHCVSPQYASKERCREEYRRALEGARERFKNIPELKKRLAGLLGRLGSTAGRFKFEHFFTDGVTYLELPLPGCGMTLWLWHNLFNKGFKVKYYPPTHVPLARRVGEWFAESVGEVLRGLGIDKYETTTDYGKVEIQLSGLDPNTAFRLFEIFAGLAPVLNDVCAAFFMRYRARKTDVRVRA